MAQRCYPVVVQSNDASYNQADAQQPRQVSEQLTGLRYTQPDEVSMSQ
jgi:hypothetical protein